MRNICRFPCVLFIFAILLLCGCTPAAPVAVPEAAPADEAEAAAPAAEAPADVEMSAAVRPEPEEALVVLDWQDTPALPEDYAAHFPALPYGRELSRREQGGYITIECDEMGEGELFSYCGMLEDMGFVGAMGSYRKETPTALLRFDGMRDPQNGTILLTYGMEPLA